VLCSCEGECGMEVNAEAGARGGGGGREVRSWVLVQGMRAGGRSYMLPLQWVELPPCLLVWCVLFLPA
jgi:hypothetical protein